MKTIQWYPGHMAKAMRMMRENLSVTDGVIFVLDARCPAASMNPELKKMAGGKPVLYVMNKADLADGKADGLLAGIRKKGAAAVKLCAVNGNSRRDIAAAIEKLIAEKRAAARDRGYNRTFRFMVAGVPNTGKSTLINLLAGERRAETGNKAGVTRGKQWIRCDDFELMDTPGTMPPAFGKPHLAIRLAYVGCINDDILDMDDIALSLLEELGGQYYKNLEQRYKITGGTPTEMLDEICENRGFKLKGNEYDYERGIRAVIDDFRKGRLGRITLDFAADIEEIDF